MANTTSLAFPNMINVAQNRVSTLEDSASVVNRSRLLILTEPTEMYNEPDQGVGLHRHMWQHNNGNQQAIILDRIKSQLRDHEPYAVAEETSYANGLLFTGSNSDNSYSDANKLDMTVSIQTTFSEQASVRIGDENVSVY